MTPAIRNLNPRVLLNVLAVSVVLVVLGAVALQSGLLGPRATGTVQIERPAADSDQALEQPVDDTQYTAPSRTQDLTIYTVLSRDAIRSIDSPRFVGPDTAAEWMRAEEMVLGLSINGDNRAYSINMLSSHEIVNDVVGGAPVAVTW